MDENTCSAKPQTKPRNEEKNYLALATQLMFQMKVVQDGNNGNQGIGGKGTQGNRGKQQSDDRTSLTWCYENPDNKATKEVRGITMNWCSNDCHDKPMWCGRRNCLNRADYSKEWQKKTQGKSASGYGPKSSAEFKIALAAITSTEDSSYKQL